MRPFSVNYREDGSLDEKAYTIRVGEKCMKIELLIELND